VVAVKVHAVFLQPLGKRAIFEASEGGEHGNLQPNVVETNVSQSVGSKASLALGLFVCERVVFITAGPIIKLCARTCAMRHFLCQSRYLFMGFMKKMKVDYTGGHPRAKTIIVVGLTRS